MRPIDADLLLRNTINNPNHAPYITKKDVQAQPTIQPEPHEGRFERKQDGVFCSVCHYGWEFITGVPAEVEREYHYCPNCGADMRGEKDG